MTEARDPVRLLIADDHLMVRQGIRALLESAPDIDVVGEAGTGTEAVTAAARLLPDVVLMDLQMPDMNGIDATRTIVQTSPNVKILVLTISDGPDIVFAALRAGALGYLLKGAGRDDLLRAVRAVDHGDAIYSPAIAQRILGYFADTSHRGPSAFPELTDREREVLDLIASGANNATIAQRLFVNPKTVRNHISNIFSKLHVADRAQAIIRARQAGLGGTSPQ